MVPVNSALAPSAMPVDALVTLTPASTVSPICISPVSMTVLVTNEAARAVSVELPKIVSTAKPTPGVLAVTSSSICRSRSPVIAPEAVSAILCVLSLK